MWHPIARDGAISDIAWRTFVLDRPCRPLPKWGQAGAPNQPFIKEDVPVASVTQTPVSTSKRRRDLVAVNIGNALEWFDWNIYAIFAPFFAAQFFNDEDPVASLLATFAIFAVGFLMRPVGGWVFGQLADARGRRYSLTIAIALAAVGSLMIAVAPTFETIGAGAAAILLLARLVQGMSHGGETGSAFTYLAEVAPDGRRGLWASSPWIGVGIGSIAATGLGALLTFILSDEQMAAYGWRIPFAVAALLGLYAIWIRVGLTELALCIQAPRTSFSYEGRELVCRPLDPAPNLERLSVVWPRSRRLSRAASYVAHLLQERGEELAPRI